MIKTNCIRLIAMMLCASATGCKSYVNVKSQSLYDQRESLSTGEISGFKAVHIFKDDYDKSVWVSPEAHCVTLSTDKKQVYADGASLHVKWDKISGGCKWIGIGFGWNNWVAKDMLDVASDCAVQMQVKSVKGSFSNLPVAFAFEDYAGVQSYFGFQKDLAGGVFNDKNWTTVTIPLSKFDFEKGGFNLESVKQFMIQLEGDGDIYLDDIKIVKL